MISPQTKLLLLVGSLYLAAGAVISPDLLGLSPCDRLQTNENPECPLCPPCPRCEECPACPNCPACPECPECPEDDDDDDDECQLPCLPFFPHYLTPNGTLSCNCTGGQLFKLNGSLQLSPDCGCVQPWPLPKPSSKCPKCPTCQSCKKCEPCSTCPPCPTCKPCPKKKKCRPFEWISPVVELPQSTALQSCLAACGENEICKELCVDLRNPIGFGQTTYKGWVSVKRI